MVNNMEEFNKILLSKRNDGKITCKFKNIHSESGKVDKEQFLEDIGFNQIQMKDKWKKVDTITAQEILEYILSFDMAHDIELVTKSQANVLASYFINKFNSDAEFFTNGDFDVEQGFYRLSGWTPLTDSIFDTGILAIDMQKIGILWAEDND
jgi:phage anti-repressor protein